MASIGRRLRKVIKNKKKKSSSSSEGPRTNLKAARKMLKGLGTSEKWWKPNEGESIIRILPANTDDGNFAYEQSQHFGFKVGGEKRAFPCMIALGHDYCPACQLVAAYEDDVDDDVKGIMRKLKPSRYFLMNVIDRSLSKPTVKMYSATPGAMRGILDILADADYGDITDPIKGRDVKIKKTGTGESTRYKILVRPNTSKIGLDDWVEQLFDLKKEAYREIPTMKEYVKYLDDSFGDVLDVKEVLRGSNKKNLKELDLDEDDDEDEDDEIEEETDEESDDEEIEEDSDEEDEEESPKRKVIKRKGNKIKLIKKRKPIEDDDEEEEGDNEN